MKFFRNERVGSLFEKQLAIIILKEVEIHGALITLTKVDVDKKLERAEAHVSVIPSERGEEVMKELNRMRGRLEHTLFLKINIKPMPVISFRLDHGPEKAAAIEKALLEDNNSSDHS